MRNQFFGDFNDYWKYGLLRGLAARGLKVGVCWMLTPDDGTHGEKRQYLAKPAEWRQYDPDLYDILQQLNEPTTPRSVQLCDEHGIIPTATYFSETVPRLARNAFLDRALEALRACAVVFFDPDNGIEVGSVSHGSRKSVKYVFWGELKETYSRGHSVVVYQHIQQVDRRRKVAELAERLGRELSSPRVDVLGPSSVAFFVVHQADHGQPLTQTIEERRGTWPDHTYKWEPPT